MGNFFPEELVEEVRLANNIVDIISEYVILKKKGRNYSGLCPFHHEKTPSFMVSPDKQIFHCFGCGVGGNAISFVMKKENLTFPEAMRMLADKAGISLPEWENPTMDKKHQFREKAYEINGLANEYYHYILTQKETGRLALDYLLKRGTSREIIDQFKLGYATPSWDGLLNYLVKKGYTETELAQLGLVLAKEKSNGHYDRFRNRVMFPIMDIRGRVVGFGGRVTDNSLPKYLNSPETEVFNKSHLLFGLNFASGAIRGKDQVIIMEGYMDVITAHQWGINNAVASLGTALTREQGKLLMRYTHNVIIAYDADQAGVTAAVRGLEILQELGCQVSVLTIPDGKDPDEFIKKQGHEAFVSLVNQARNLIDYKLAKIMEKIDTSRIEGKLAALGELFSNLENMDTEVERGEAISFIAHKLGMYPGDARLEFEKYIQNRRKKLNNRDNKADKRHNNTMSANGLAVVGDKKPIRKSARTENETGLLRLMLEDRAVYEKVKQEIGLEFFERPEYTNIIKAYNEKIAQDAYFEPGELISYFGDDDPHSQLLTQVLMDELHYQDIYKASEAIIKSIKKTSIDSEKEELLKEISVAEKSGNQALVARLLLKYQKLF